MQKTIIAFSALALVSACGPSASKDIVVTGEMTYKEQVQLPPTAKAHIELTAPQFDQPTVKLFSQDIAAPGSTIPFSVTVSGKDIPESGDYVFDGYVKDGERFIFGSGKVDVAHADLTKPLKIELHYAPPPKNMYKCGPANTDWYEVAIDLSSATIRNINAPAETSLPMTVPGDKPTFSNGAYTITKDGQSISFGKGKAAPVACVTGRP